MGRLFVSRRMKRSAVLLCVALLAVLGPARATAQEKSVQELVAAFEEAKKEDPAARSAALNAIAARAEDDALDYLLRRLDLETAAGERASFIGAIGRCPNPRSQAVLRAIVGDPTKSYNDRWYAVNGLDEKISENLEFLASGIKKSEFAQIVSAALTKLARSTGAGARDAIREAYRSGDDARKAQVLNACAGVLKPDAVYLEMVAPNLTPQSEPVLRQAALRFLSAARDARFFDAIRALTAKETNAIRLAEWIRLAAPYDSVEALLLVLPYVSGDPDDQVTQAFEEMAVAMQSAAVREWFRKYGPGHPQRLVRLGAAKNFLKKPATEDLPAALLLAKDSDAEVQREALLLMASFDDDESAKALRALLGHKDPTVAARALRSLWRRKGGAEAMLLPTLEIAAKSRSWEMRVVAIELLGAKKAADSRAAFQTNFKHPRRQVREAAYDGTARIGDRAAVTALIDQLPHEKDNPSIQKYLADLLCRLTDFDWGTDAGRWHAWWDKTPPEFPIHDIAKRKKTSAAAAGYGSYYGLTVRSERVAFIVDISGSMTAKMYGETRIDHAKKSLVKVLKTFEPSVAFMLLAFNQGIIPYAPKPLPATKDEIAKAVRWVEALQPSGGTNVFDSLERVLENEEVDAIYLLTDGAPSAGRILDPDEILKEIRLRNQFLRVAIHTIDLSGDQISKNFLKRLAEQNGGEFVNPLK